MFLTLADLQVFAPSIDPAKAEAMIDDATALALIVAPCIASATFANSDAVRAILRGAILRWNEAGTGALASQQAGPFGMSVDTRQERRGMFWPSEIAQLQNLCSNGTGGVYTVSLAGPDAQPTSPIPFA